MNSRKNAPTLQTVLHVYEIYTDKSGGAAEYAALRKKLTAMGLECFETHGGKSHYCPELAGDVTLETSNLFDNQWNTPTHRVFDWAQDYKPFRNGHLKRGHWLEQTDAMREVRATVTKCGYCGAYGTVADGPEFCQSCFTSEYLKEAQLHLTRMLPIASERGTRPPLTNEEAARLTLVYKAAQGAANMERAIQRRERLGRDAVKRRDTAIAKAEKDAQSARDMHAATLWLLDRGIRNDTIENLIHYTHRDVFTFGWRSKLGAEAVSELLDAMDEFPYTYEILTADGRTLGSA